MLLRSGSSNLVVKDGAALAGEAAQRPVAVAVTGMASGAHPDLELAIARGTEVLGDLGARPVGPDRVALTLGGVTSEIEVAELRDLTDQLTRHRVGDPPWLFARPVKASRPSELERSNLVDLEATALALDQLADAGDGSATESARRRALLVELEAAGLLDGELAGEKRAWLRHWQLPVLAGYLDAAVQAWRYYRSPERAEATEGAATPPSLLGATISIDWFRLHDHTPLHWSKHAWIASIEACWIGDFAAGEDQPAAGSWFSSSGGTRAEVHFRSDDGVHRSLVRTAVTD